MLFQQLLSTVGLVFYRFQTTQQTLVIGLLQNCLASVFGINFIDQIKNFIQGKFQATVICLREHSYKMMEKKIFIFVPILFLEHLFEPVY